MAFVDLNTVLPNSDGSEEERFCGQPINGQSFNTDRIIRLEETSEVHTHPRDENCVNNITKLFYKNAQGEVDEIYLPNSMTYVTSSINHALE